MAGPGKRRAGMFEVQVPFFLPLWRRVAVVLVTLGWTAVEATAGSPFWAVLFGAAGIWCAYAFFVAWDEEKVRAMIGAPLKDADKNGEGKSDG